MRSLENFTVNITWEQDEEKEVYEMIANNQEEIRWFEDNFNEIEEKYKNKWIAISGNTIIASGKSFGEVWEMAKNKGIKAPFIVEIEPSGWDPLWSH